MTQRPIDSDWYGYPQYYDLLFRDETAREVQFLQGAATRFALGPVARVLELGCGGGRLLTALLRRGFQGVGIDQNTAALDYLKDKLKRTGLRAELHEGDFSDFRLNAPVDLAINTWNTFRHLLTEEQALSHLRAVSAALRPGGLFVLGLHILPLDVDEESMERWTARHGTLRVTATLRVLTANRKRRIERLRLSLLAKSTKVTKTPKREVRLRTEFEFRMYTADQLRRTLAKVPEFELCHVTDFWYDLEEALPFDDVLTDAVLVFRRK